MTNLIGTYECKLDTKGRLALPIALKKQLGVATQEVFIIKRSVFQNCLEVYPQVEWEKVMGKLNQLNRFVKKNNDFIRKFSAGVKEASLDTSGRLLIAKDLQDFACLEKEVVISSAINIFEVWDKAFYEKAVEDTSHFADLAEEVMGNLNNLE